mgnify:FL=1
MSHDNDRLVAALRSAMKENARLREEAQRLPEPIAVVGMGCRLPGGVNSPEDLWDLLERGEDVIGPLPRDRGWDIDALTGESGDAPRSAMRQGYFLDDVSAFDPAFFGISPKEAEAMDPQQRLMLEVAWETVERSGIVPDSLVGSDTGVYVGSITQEYGPPLTQAPDDGFAMTGTTGSAVSGRVSYTLGSTGPALTVDTACSSSLVAVQMAVQALRAGECSLAIAGGTTVMVGPGALTEFTHLRGLAPDGRCKAFGADADGAGFSEGVGAVMLERLRDARRNGRRVLAVIRGAAVNSDGASNGLTAPNGPSQTRVIRKALADARLEPGDVDLVEAHGTGTTLGDPIEAQALLAAYGTGRERPLWLGSLKSNIGHPQAAAGVVGMIKLVLALEHKTLPRTLHAEEPTPHVDWSSGAMRLLNEARPWPDTGRPRRAAVSSFGLSGTNAHVIVEQAPEAESTASRSARTEGSEGGARGTARIAGSVPWTLSAHSEAALAAQAARLRDHVIGHPDLDPMDVGWSLATTRAALEHRAVVQAPDRDTLLARLDTLASGRPDPDVVRGTAAPDRRPVLVFPGQGGQWPGMAEGLLGSSPEFAAHIAECEQALAPYVDWSLTDVLGRRPGAASLERVDVVQPVLWAVMVALARLWISHGLSPAAVVGHSQGEIAAACVSGALTLTDGAKVVALRSRSVLELSGTGAMASVGRPADLVRADLAESADGVYVAVVNSPSATVVAGEPEAVRKLVKDYEEAGVQARMIAVDYASHTPHVERSRARLTGELSGVQARRPDIPMYSTLTGEMVEAGELDAEYWYRNLSDPVEFGRVVHNLLVDEHDVFVEVGPHPVLSIALQECAEAANLPETVVLGTLRRQEGGLDRFLTSLAEAHACGLSVDWRSVFGDGAREVDLPTYAFQHQRYWRVNPAHGAAVTPTVSSTPEPDTPGAETPVRWELPPGLSAQEREEAALAMVREETAVLLGHTDATTVESHRGFLDAGGTSLAAVRLRNRINELTGLELPVTVVLDHSTPRALARHVVERLDRTEAMAGPPPLPVLSELERLERAVRGGDVDGATREVLGARLRDLLGALSEGSGRDLDSADIDLDEASDDQLLDFIDQEFGIS